MTARTKTESTSRILLTGFEPFDGRERNASWIAASALAQQHLPGVELRAAQIPVCWDAPRRVLDPIVTEWQPHVIIGLGEGEPGMFRVESVANNTRRERADNDGKFPEGRVIDPRGPLRRTASADCITLCKALTALDIPVRVSTDAGAFLCEELLYTLEGLRAAQDALDTVLFVHVPPFGTALEFQGQQRVCDEALLLEFANLLLARVLTLPYKKKHQSILVVQSE
jgi:pyroglutamyl-peptidase